jgi:hypothetical protein
VLSEDGVSDDAPSSLSLYSEPGDRVSSREATVAILITELWSLRVPQSSPAKNKLGSSVYTWGACLALALHSAALDLSAKPSADGLPTRSRWGVWSLRCVTLAELGARGDGDGVEELGYVPLCWEGRKKSGAAPW